MSETTTEPVLPGQGIPNFSVVPAPDYSGPTGRSVQNWTVTFGTRSAGFRKVSLGDSWDLMELAAGQPNDRWYNMATIAAAVMSIDGLPVPVTNGSIKRQEIRDRLDRLGMDGLLAVAEGLRIAEPATVTADQVTATAKNS